MIRNDYPFRANPQLIEIENKEMKEKILILDTCLEEAKKLYSESLNANNKLTEKLNKFPSYSVEIEYTVIEHHKLDQDETAGLFDRLGRDGWMLVNATDLNAFFYRLKSK